MRRPLVLANWKMNGSLRANRELIEGMVSGWGSLSNTDVVVCPPFVYLPQVVELVAQTEIGLGAQDMSKAALGAYTGEVSAQMLAEFKCRFVLVGHSERREQHNESDRDVAEKFTATQNAGLVPVLCVGETLAQRDAGEALAVIGQQLAAVFKLAGRDALESAVIAYEPVWAIGTGRTASPSQAQEVHAFIRAELGAVAERVSVVYGGSVKPSNAEELFAQRDIDGALVGGASLKAEDFLAICRAAELSCS
mgnify:CR=1 FL=1